MQIIWPPTQGGTSTAMYANYKDSDVRNEEELIFPTNTSQLQPIFARSENTKILK